MTTTIEDTVKSGAQTRERKARFTDLLASEWIKLWSLRSTFWAFAAAAVIILAISVSGAYSDYKNFPGLSADDQQYFRMFGAVGDSFSLGAATFLCLGAGAIGAITILGEYTTGMIRTTFTAVPARRSVMASKVVVVTATTAVFGVTVALMSFGLAQWILSNRHVAVGFGDPGVVRLLVASALLAPVAALVGMGIAAVIRNAVLTIVTTIALLFVLPSLLNGKTHMSATILHMTVLRAWERLSTVGADGSRWPWTTTGAWTVLAIWAVVAAALVVFPSNRRDL